MSAFPSPSVSPEAALSAIPVIVNPQARSARAGGRLEAIRSLSSRVVLHETARAGDAARLAGELARAGAPLIVAAGGDGTVNEVVNGMVKAGGAGSTTLGILPTGTMNVFAAELGMKAARLDECWRVITEGQPRKVDLWRLNETLFVQLAGAGVDAAIIQGTTWEAKKRWGPFSYIFAGLRLLRGPAPVLTVTAPGREPVRGTTVLIGNGRNYGGPFPLFPQAIARDGLLDVVVLPQAGLREFYAVGQAMLSGEYAASRGVHYFQTDQLRVEGGGAVPYEVDGELAGEARVLDFSRHGSLRVMAPAPPLL